jgi:hypothetical protein
MIFCDKSTDDMCTTDCPLNCRREIGCKRHRCQENCGWMNQVYKFSKEVYTERELFKNLKREKVLYLTKKLDRLLSIARNLENHIQQCNSEICAIVQDKPTQYVCERYPYLLLHTLYFALLKSPNIAVLNEEISSFTCGYWYRKSRFYFSKITISIFDAILMFDSNTDEG